MDAVGDQYLSDGEVGKEILIRYERYCGRMFGMWSGQSSIWKWGR